MSLFENECLGCGCSDHNACVVDGQPCHWLDVDKELGVGICSCCESELPRLAEYRNDIQLMASGDTESSADKV